MTTSEKHCHYCINNVEKIDWKDIATLQRFVSHYARIVPRRRSGLCNKHQRKIALAIKRARTMGLLPYIKA